MTTGTRRAARRQAPLESGAVETEQVTTIRPSDVDGNVIPLAAPVVVDQGVVEQTTEVTPADPAEVAEVQQPTSAELLGSEVASIRERNDATDKAEAAMKAAYEAAGQAQLMHQYAQEALTAACTRLITTKGLDPRFQYRVDLSKGAIIAIALAQPPQ